MICAMLQSDPMKRPRIHKLFEFEFLSGSHIPNSLPISCLTMAPRADQLEQAERMNRKPLSEMNGAGGNAIYPRWGMTYGAVVEIHLNALFYTFDILR